MEDITEEDTSLMFQALHHRLMVEIALVDTQIASSRKLRGAAPYDPVAELGYELRKLEQYLTKEQPAAAPTVESTATGGSAPRVAQSIARDETLEQHELQTEVLEPATPTPADESEITKSSAAAAEASTVVPEGASAPPVTQHVDPVHPRDAGESDKSAAAAAEVPMTAPSASPPVAAATHEDRVRAIFQRYDPTRVDKVPGLLRKYAGSEESLIGALVGKYGPEPVPADSTTVAEDATRIASEALNLARKQADDEAIRLVAEASAREAAEKETARVAEEVEASRRAAEEEVARKAADQEATRLEAARLAAVDAARKAAEEEAERQMAARKAAEEETAARLAAEEEETARQEAARLAAAEATRLAAVKVAEEEAARREAEEEAARVAARLAAEEAAARKAAEEEAARLAAEQAARKAAEEETARQNAERIAAEAATRKAEEEEAARLAAEKAEREAAQAEAARLAAVEAARLAAEQEDARKEAARQEAVRVAAEEAARTAAEETARKAAEAESVRQATEVEATRLAEETARREAARKAAEEATAREQAGQEATRGATENARSAAAEAPSTTAATGLTIEDRIRAMYAKYDPAKADKCTALLQKYAGNEEALLAALVSRYGPEPTPAAPAGATSTKAAAEEPAAGGALSHRDRLVAMYQKYAPQRLSTVDSTLAKYQGSEDQVIGALVAKYGPEPDAAEAAQLLVAAASGAAAGSTASADPAPSSPTKGDERGSPTGPLVATTTTGAETPASPAPSSASASLPMASPRPAPESAEELQARIQIMFETYAPEKLGTVPQLFTKYAGNERALLHALVGKYGAEPASDASPSASPSRSGGAASSASAASPAPKASHRDRIVAMFTKYAPHRLDSVDGVLVKYKGSEETIIEALVSKYGPEPAVEAATSQAEGGETPASPASPADSNFAPADRPPSRQLTPRSGHTPAAGATPLRSTTPRTTASVPKMTKEQYQEKIKAIYEKYAPDKVDKIDTVMAKYEGAEDSLLAALITKYGVLDTEPAAPTEQAADQPPPPTPTQPQGPPPPRADPTTLIKGGVLWNYGKKSLFRSFKQQYVVADSEKISWYKTEKDWKDKPAAPIDSVPLYILAKNSRGSSFKNPAVCMPTVTLKDCPKANDPKMHYFGLQYFEANGDAQVLAFATESFAERNEWVRFITTFVKLYVPLGVENAEALAAMPVGANSPLHTKEVLGGEAPGSKDPTPVRTK
jgi:hypothetical protein